MYNLERRNENDEETKTKYYSAKEQCDKVMTRCEQGKRTWEEGEEGRYLVIWDMVQLDYLQHSLLPDDFVSLVGLTTSPPLLPLPPLPLVLVLPLAAPCSLALMSSFAIVKKLGPHLSLYSHWSLRRVYQVYQRTFVPFPLRLVSHRLNRPYFLWEV